MRPVSRVEGGWFESEAMGGEGGREGGWVAGWEGGRDVSQVGVLGYRFNCEKKWTGKAPGLSKMVSPNRLGQRVFFFINLPTSQIVINYQLRTVRPRQGTGCPYRRSECKPATPRQALRQKISAGTLNPNPS